MRIGRYSVDAGSRKEGGQAFVYFGRDPEGRSVAVKVARPSKWSRDRMRREIAVQATLMHPNVMPILEHAADFSWYAMPQAECSLDELGPLQASQWMTLRAGLLGVASAVAYAHAAGYVHRDLSSGNILVFADRWSVGDWGFVYRAPTGGTRMTQPLERFGTPEFMSPEMAVDPKRVGPAADVYSIGRLAVWATGLQREAQTAEESGAARWWRVLIDGTTQYEPSARWTMDDVNAHLRSRPPLVPLKEPTFRSPILAGQSEPCPHCGRSLGVDGSERCLGCHSLLPY